MYYTDESQQTFAFVAGVAVGMVIGAGIALLTAPNSGRRTRRRLRRAVERGSQPVVDRFEDWGEDVRSAVDAGRRRLNL